MGKTINVSNLSRYTNFLRFLKKKIELFLKIAIFQATVYSELTELSSGPCSSSISPRSRFLKAVDG